MHIHIRDTRLDGVDHCIVGIQNRVVDDLLVLSELSIGRVRACDVRAEAVVLSPHLKENNVAILDGLVVGRTSMTIVRDGATGATAGNAVVANMARTTIVVAVVQED